MGSWRGAFGIPHPRIWHSILGTQCPGIPLAHGASGWVPLASHGPASGMALLALNVQASRSLMGHRAGCLWHPTSQHLAWHPWHSMSRHPARSSGIGLGAFGITHPRIWHGTLGTQCPGIPLAHGASGWVPLASHIPASGMALLALNVQASRLLMGHRAGCLWHPTPRHLALDIQASCSLMVHSNKCSTLAVGCKHHTLALLNECNTHSARQWQHPND